VEDPEVIAAAAREAGDEPEPPRDVDEAAQEARFEEAFRHAQAALSPPPDAERTGLFPSFRRRRA
jgi:hypothetical protein